MTKDTLEPGLTHLLKFQVLENKTVSHLYPEVSEFAEMPSVFATGVMVGLMEWTCMKILEHHLEEGEGSLDAHANISHSAATFPGITVATDAECISVDGRRVRFAVSANHGVDLIGNGEIERFIVSWGRFNESLEAKRSKTAAE